MTAWFSFCLQDAIFVTMLDFCDKYSANYKAAELARLLAKHGQKEREDEEEEKEKVSKEDKEEEYPLVGAYWDFTYLDY